MLASDLDPNDMNCLSEGSLADFFDEGLSPGMHERVLNHLAECTQCELAVRVLRSGLGDTGQRDASGKDDPSLDRFVAGLENALDFLPGTRAGRYEIRRIVGRGAMGVVYAAYDPELDRHVALKVVLERPAGARAVRDNDHLVREARSMARLMHPNVVTVHDVGVASGRIFLAMELVAGGTLGEWTRAERRSAAEVLATYEAVGDALAAAHRAGVVHRDLKPQNVLVTTDGRPKITDFGLADTLVDGAVSNDAAPNETVAWAGTPAYMAPEAFKGETTDARSDQYAFAVCLHEALSGRKPVTAKTLVELRARVTAGELSIAEAIPRRIRAVLRRALSVDRHARYPTMDSLLSDLGRATAKRAGPSRTLLVLGGLAAAASAAYVVMPTRITPTLRGDVAAASPMPPAEIALHTTAQTTSTPELRTDAPTAPPPRSVGTPRARAGATPTSAAGATSVTRDATRATIATVRTTTPIEPSFEDPAAAAATSNAPPSPDAFLRSRR